jgi:ComF family protein
MHLTRFARLAASLVAPPRCAVCAGSCNPVAALCAGCAAEIDASAAGPAMVPGIAGTWSATTYEGTAQHLVGALKFGGRIALAEVAAAAIARVAPPGLVEGVLVPVPAAGSRRRRRGFDPAELIAAVLARDLGLPLVPCLRRGSSRRQVGRPRAERLADPPRVRTRGQAPETCVLVDDVVTTGATLAACAGALRVGGARRINAVTFARTP